MSETKQFEFLLNEMKEVINLLMSLNDKIQILVDNSNHNRQKDDEDERCRDIQKGLITMFGNRLLQPSERGDCQ